MSNDTKIKTTIYRLLAQREHSTAMLKQKLLTKGYEENDISRILKDLSQDGTVSDQRFLESYVRYRQTCGYGPLRIRQELLLKGLPKEMIEDQLNFTDNAWFTEVERVWRKRFCGEKPSDHKARGQQLRFLQQRGFTQEQIHTIFDTHL